MFIIHKIFTPTLMMLSFYSTPKKQLYTSLTFHNAQHKSLLHFVKKELKRAFLPKYIIFLHRYDCWCISLPFKVKLLVTSTPREGNPGNVLLTSRIRLKYFYQCSFLYCHMFIINCHILA